MNPHRRSHGSGRLVRLILLALAYAGVIHFRRAVTGFPALDGVIGVILGLYICSHPAANAVDRLFFERSAQRQVSSRRAGVAWLALNLLTLLIGWLVIVIGATRLSVRAV
jgi:hypothetical protein